MAKDARRREEALRKRRNAKLAKSAIIGLFVAITPLLLYVATRT